MIAYVESNFLLELARQQEDSGSAEDLLRLAETQKLSLVFPSFALCEPFSTLSYYGSERARFVEGMQRQLRELNRLRPHRSLASLLQPLGPTLLSIQREEMDLLELAVQRMLIAGKSIPLTADIFRDARAFEVKFGLSPQDSIVFASVLSDLKQQPPDVAKCFISRNPKDFDDPTIVSDLRAQNCRYIARFSDALSFIKSNMT